MSKNQSTKILGFGAGLPRTAVSNQELIQAHGLDSSDEWIATRTGIRQRYICAEDENVSTLATVAAQQALAQADIAPEEVDLILVATCTPDRAFPATAVYVQRALGCKGAAFDLNAVCSGFMYGLTTADSLLKAGQGTTALVIGAECFSRILDWQDRSTCVLFGDGAGAAVLRQAEEGPSLLGSRIFADGHGAEALYAPGTGGPVFMNGREVYKQAVRTMGNADAAWLAEHGLTQADINWLVPHQANSRIIDAAAKQMALPAEKVIKTVDRHANTSAASIPLALSVAQSQVKAGDILLLQAFGAGFTWGEALVKW